MRHPAFLALAALACGGDKYTTDASSAAYTDLATTDGYDDDYDYTYGPDTGSAPTAPPEQEEDLLLLPPAQTDAFVFVPNPERDTLTRIDVRTQQVETTTVGVRPERVLATPDHRRVVVLNRGDDTVTVIEVDTLEERTVEVRDHLNQMVLSPDSAWAVLFHDSALDDPDDPPPDGLQSFNEVSFVQVETAVHFPMAVGFDPRMVRFTPDGALAVVVSDAMLARVDLAELPPSPDLIELAPSVLVPPRAEEVIVAADGSFAWVRQFGATELLVVDLASGTVTPVAAGGNPTDLDLSPDGAQAVAVARASQELWVFDARDPFAPPSVVPLPPSGYGSLHFSPTGDQAVLYTTATPLERFALWSPATGEVTERLLVKPVSSVAIDPTGGTLLVFHPETDGPDTEPQFAGKPALTLVDLGDPNRSNPLLLPAAPLGYANSTSGKVGYFVMEGSPFFEVLDFRTLLHEQYVLPSIPRFVGVLPDLAPEPPAWVSQEHPLGRVSFFDPQSESLETLTGFELNAGIEGGE